MPKPEDYTTPELGTIMSFFIKRSERKSDIHSAEKDLIEANGIFDILKYRLQEAWENLELRKQKVANAQALGG